MIDLFLTTQLVSENFEGDMDVIILAGLSKGTKDLTLI